MDYDESTISTVYDEARGLAPDLLRQWLELVARDAGPAQGSLIVDLGCGTGRFSEPLAERFSARVLGVDPSGKMLDVARQRTRTGRVEFLQSTAPPLPLLDSTVDTVFMSMVLHHLEDIGASAKECRRILRPNGRVCVRNIILESDFPHRHFFPGVRELIEAELPSRGEVEERFAAAGFSIVGHEVVTQVIAATWPEFVRKMSLRAYSTLARLDDKDFEAGIIALEAHGEKIDPDRAVMEEVDWFVFKAL